MSQFDDELPRNDSVAPDTEADQLEARRKKGRKATAASRARKKERKILQSIPPGEGQEYVWTRNRALLSADQLQDLQNRELEFAELILSVSDVINLLPTG